MKLIQEGQKIKLAEIRTKCSEEGGENPGRLKVENLYSIPTAEENQNTKGRATCPGHGLRKMFRKEVI